MKRNLFYLLMLVCSISVFTACSNDDDPKYPIDQEIAGTYKGTLDVFLGETNIAPNTPKNISITNAGDNRINMGLKNLEILGMNLTIDIPNCEVKESDDGYSFTGSQTLTLQAPIGDCPTTVNGTVSGGKTTINLDITVPAQDNLKVKVTYKGAKLTGSESSEAKILSFTFDSSNDANAIVVSQPVEKDGKFSFVVASDATTEQIKALVPTITISDKATLISGSEAVDFNKAVTYMVVAENGTLTNYTVLISGRALTFDFEEWEDIPGSMYVDYVYQLPVGGPWGSTNDGVTTIKGVFSVGAPEIVEPLEYAVASTTDIKKGKKAVVIKTLDTFINKDGVDYNAAFGGMIPYNTAGSLFLGEFSTNMDDILASTKFGIPYVGNEPLVFSGWYKYVAGKVYRDNSNVEVKDRVDKCDIYAVLYEAEDENGNDVILYGGSTDEANKDKIITNSPYIVLRAQLKDKTEKKDWTQFEIPFEKVGNKTYDSSKKYKITFVCTSSEEGATYNGAPGSALTIDDFSISTK